MKSTQTKTLKKYDEGIISIYRESFPIARKSVVCLECGAAIDVGERHMAFTGSARKKWITGKKHMKCHQLLEMINQKHTTKDGEPVVSFGQMIEFVASNRGMLDDKMRLLLARIRKRQLLYRREQKSKEKAR